MEGDEEKMKDIGTLRAYLAEIHKTRNRAKLAVDARDSKELIVQLDIMQTELLEMKTIAYQQEDV
jgi:hypothetical protein